MALTVTAVRGERDRHLPRESSHHSLRRAVRSPAYARADAADRGDIHNPATAACNHSSCRLLPTQEGTDDVHDEHAHPVIDRIVKEWMDAGDAGVVYEHLTPAPAFLHLGEDAGDRRWIGDIEPDPNRGGRWIERLHCGDRGLFIDIGQHYALAVAVRLARDGHAGARPPP